MDLLFVVLGKVFTEHIDEYLTEVKEFIDFKAFTGVDEGIDGWVQILL